MPPFDYNTCVDRDGDGLIKTSMGLANVLDRSLLHRSEVAGGLRKMI